MRMHWSLTNRMNGVISASLVLVTVLATALFCFGPSGPGAFIGAKSAVAQQARKRLANERIPIKVTSDRMEVDNTSNSIIFVGNVVVTRQEMKMTADRLEVLNDQQTNQLKSIAATGNVTITQGDRKATGKQAFYVEGEEKIVLQGNARATEGPNVITGEAMTLYLRTNRTVVTGTPQRRVNVIFHPKSLPGKRPSRSLGTSSSKSTGK